MKIQKKHQPAVEPFNVALKSWLSGTMSGHLGPYMYTDDRDDHRWKEGHSSDAYYVGLDDKKTFDLMIKDFNGRAETIFDLGPGGLDSVSAKSLPLARAAMAANYLAVDLSSTLASAAADHIGRELNIQSQPVINNFFDDFTYSAANAFIVLMGGTLGNLETHKTALSLKKRLAQIFSSYRTAVKQSGSFLVSFDANSEVDEILKCYQNPQLGRLVHSCLDRSMDTTSFDYQVTWSPENYRVALNLRSKRDQLISFDGEQFAIREGEDLSVLNSYRFPVDFVIEAAESVGWVHWKTWTATGRVHYVLFVVD
ncbi:MAG: L-histidine N(alpha)-methyltransferase [Pseudomonadota bacterium]|nr:L-histidine N(alpha)-methyltransferase [Pseudomonadota bacterium]